MSSPSVPTVEPHETFRSRVSRPLWVFAFLLLAGAIANGWSIGRASVGLDYLHFWAIGQLAPENRPTIYSPDAARLIPAGLIRALTPADKGTRYLASLEKRRVFEITATPFLYSLLGGITTGDYELDYTAFQLLCLASLVTGLFLLTKAFRYTLLESVPAAACILLFSTAYFSDLGVGNVNQLQVGGLAVFLAIIRRRPTIGRDAAAGTLLGILCMFKPNLALVPGLLAVAWIIGGRFRTLAAQSIGGLAGAGGAFLLSAFYFGSAHIWIDWWHGLRRFMREANPAATAGNVSLSRILHDLTGWNAGVWLLLVGCAAFAVCCWVGKRSRAAASPDQDFESFLTDARTVLIGTVIMLLTADLVWLHYLLLAIPMPLLLLRPTGRGASPSNEICRGLAVLVLAAYSMPVFKLLSVSDHPALPAFVLAGATLLLLILSLIDAAKGAGIAPLDEPAQPSTAARA